MKSTIYFESAIYPRYTVLYYYHGVVVLGKRLTKDINEVQEYNCYYIDNLMWIKGFNHLRILWAKFLLFIKNE